MIETKMFAYDESVEVVETEGTGLSPDEGTEENEEVKAEVKEEPPPPQPIIPEEVEKSEVNYTSASNSSSGDDEEAGPFLSSRKQSALVNRFKQVTMQHQEAISGAGKNPGTGTVERPKSIRVPEPPAKKSDANPDHSEDEDEEDESEYQPNKLAQIEGGLKLGGGARESAFLPNPKAELSSDDDFSYSDLLEMEMDEDELEKMSYEEFAHFMALEALAEPEPFLPALPTLRGSSDEEVKNAVIKKRWREVVLDRKRSQLKMHAKLSYNPGVHRSGYGMYQAGDYEGLNTTPEIKELFQYITMYSPPASSSQVDVKLRPFIPEFYPSVGDIDAFLKVIHPEIGNDSIGIKVLDEPCAFPSDPSVLDLRLRAMAKQSSARAVVVKKVENIGKNSKVIDNWIKDISDLHRAKPSPSIHYSKPMPDIDTLLQEWPPGFEKLLATTKLPPPELDCDLKTYVDLVCNLLDIPVYKSRIQSLHVLATLYLAHKSFGNYSFGPGGKSNKNASANQRDEGEKLGTNENGVDRLELE